MSEPRKIVLILGNGFDVDLGLQTRYSDFWESEFCPKDYPAPLIHHLNQCWPDNLEAVRWYDLENELLNYYNEIAHSRRIPDVITQEEKEFIIKVNLVNYSYGVGQEYQGAANSLLQKGLLKKNPKQFPKYIMPYREELKKSSIWRDREALKKIKEGLCNYLNSIDKPIPESDTAAFHLLLAMTKSADAGDFINIFTFNYTRVQMRGYELKEIPVHYMHGRCEDGKIIVGTRDDLQMDPSYDFLLKSMDDSFTPPDIVAALKDADEVIIFGHSLGENDRQYFAPFFLKQADYDNPERKDITIFTRDDNSKIEIKRALQKMTDGKLSALYSINQPIIIRTKNLQEDQKLMYDFLLKHHTRDHYAMEVIGKLLKKKES